MKSGIFEVQRRGNLADSDPRQELRRVEYGGEIYRLFASGEAKVSYVLGEFYWQVRVGETALVSDFICPPRIESSEAYPGLQEVTWSQGEYVEPAVIEAAFQPPEPLPERNGIYLNQPNRYEERWRRVRWLAPLFALVLTAIQLVSLNRSANARVFEQEFVYRAADTNRIVVTAPFEISGGHQAVKVMSRAAVNNNWLALDIDLVNAQTQQKISFAQGMELYSGYDDGPWSEGSPVKTSILPSVSPGQYYLRIEPSADPSVAQMAYHVTVIRDVTGWSNYWIGLGAVLICPVYVFFRRFSFEQARWSESDYSPYGGSSDQEEEKADHV